jgi:Arc/MetJ family transcription regulator
MASIFKPRLDILPPPQQRLWPELRELPEHFALYGDTAIALRLGHRVSIDFDFFGTEPIDPQTLLMALPVLQGAEVSQLEANSLTCMVDRGGAVQLSFFGVPRLKRLEPPAIADGHGMKVASLLDLAATKASVLQKRAASKDYIDLDALMVAGVSLASALAAGAALYGSAFNPQVTLKALVYYEDGDLDEVPEAVRERLRAAVRSVDLDALPRLERGPEE